MEIGCVVLAGGKSLRMRHDKVLEIIDDKSLLERAINAVSVFNSDVIIVTATKQAFPLFNEYQNLKIVTDIYHGRGPLGGIHAGLTASDRQHNLVVACDMPFLNQSLMNLMINNVAGYDVIIPRAGYMLEPLHAVYSKECLTPIEDLLKHGKKCNISIRELLPLVNVRYLDANEIKSFDPQHLSFFNINTESDLETARELAKHLITNRD
ncbi:molybdenum cofactor guanylyltransferase [Chloroflexota bacterium]